MFKAARLREAQATTMAPWILTFICLAAKPLPPLQEVPVRPALSAAGRLHIEAQPDHLVLGEGGFSELTLRVTNAQGEIEDQAPPQLQSSVGALQNLTRIAPGVFHARFVPPEAGPPSVAIILGRVQTPGGLITGWTRIPLWGKGQVEIVTKANAKVWLRIGEQAFGPVDSDAKGKASVDIQVPPGPKSAIAETEDGAGNKSKKTIDLGVPGFNRLAAFALDESTVADGSEQSGLIAVAVDGRGAPLIDAAIKRRAKRGKMGAITPLGPGIYRVAYSSPTKVGRGGDRVFLSLKHDNSSKVEVSITLTAGDPSVIHLDLSSIEYIAGSGEKPLLTLRAADVGGNPAPASLVQVTTSKGAVLGVPRKLDDGGLAIPIEIDNNFSGRTQIEVSAQARRGDAKASTTIALQPGPCSKVTISGPKQVVADGRSVEFTAQFPDSFGNLIHPKQTPQVQAKFLQVTRQVLDPKGQLKLVMQTTEMNTSQDINVAVSLGQVRGMHTVRLIRHGGLDARIGPRSVVSYNYGSRIMVGLGLDWQLGLPFGDDLIWLGSSATFLQSGPAASDDPLDAQVHRLRSAQLLATACYEHKLISRLVVHGGLGLGPQFAVPEARVLSLARQGAPLIFGLSAEAMGGLGLQLGPGQLGLDLRAGYTLPFNASDELGPISGTSLSLGYRVGL